ncbi:hypothetical protein AO361_09940 [Pseudomonas fluorescens]|nr:hypothetical protein AO361_09940 [Pseudomonas fluorescens]
MQFSSPLSNIDKAGTNGKSLAAAAGAIGNILSKIDGQGGGSRHTGSTGGKKNYGNSATNPVFIKLESSNSKIFAIFETQVKLIDNAKPMKLHAFAHLAADGSAFTEDSLITTKPKISTIKHKEFVSIISKADELEIGTIEGTYEIRVQLPRGYATTLKVELSEVTS